MTDVQEQSLAIVDPVTPAEFKKGHNNLIAFVRGTLKEAKTTQEGGRDKMSPGDYGIIPRTGKKSLLKPGAEKLLKLFGYSAKNDLIDKVEDWKAGFVMYRYKCTITHIASGKFIADATRSCTNKEPKHASKNIYEAANTIEGIAQKRALVAATVQATMASEIFDADVSETETVAPNGPTTKDDDPRRVKVMGGYFMAARDRGFTPEQAKAAAHRKLEVKSLTDATTQQIEGLTVELTKTFKHVGEGNPPEKLTDLDIDSGKAEEVGQSRTDDVVDGQLVDPAEDLANTSDYWCRGSKHDPEHPETMVATTMEDPWCDDPKCKDEYYPPEKEKNERPWEKKPEVR